MRQNWVIVIIALAVVVVTSAVDPDYDRVMDNGTLSSDYSMENVGDTPFINFEQETQKSTTLLKSDLAVGTQYATDLEIKELTMVAETSQTREGASVKMSNEMWQKSLATLTSLANVMSRKSPSIAILADTIVSNLKLNKNSDEGVTSILDQSDALEKKLNDDLNTERQNIFQTRATLNGTINSLTRQVSDKLTAINSITANIKIAKGRLESLKQAIVSVEGEEEQLDDNMRRRINETSPEESGFYARREQREKEIHVLGVGLLLTCEFREFSKNPDCIYLKQNPREHFAPTCTITIGEKCVNQTASATLSFEDDFRSLTPELTRRVDISNILNCFNRASAYFQWCGTGSSPVTAAFKSSPNSPLSSYVYPGGADIANLQKISSESDRAMSEAFAKHLLESGLDKKRKEDDATLEQLQLSGKIAYVQNVNDVTAQPVVMLAESESDAATHQEKVKLKLISTLQQLFDHNGTYVGGEPTRAFELVTIIQSLQTGDALKGKEQKLVKLLSDLRSRISSEQQKEDTDWNDMLRLMDKDLSAIMDDIMGIRQRHRQLEAQEKDSKKQIEASVQDVSDAERDMTALSKALRSEMKNLDDAEINFFAKESALLAEIEQCHQLRSVLRQAVQKLEPSCGKGDLGCTAEGGTCVWANRFGNAVYCSCNANSYGNRCEKTRCPGRGGVMYPASDYRVCSGNAQCDNINGTCDPKCTNNTFHGPKKACEYRVCPSLWQTSYHDLELDPEQKKSCSFRSHGECNNLDGKCTCDYKYAGDMCNELKCKGMGGVLYTSANGAACNGHGICVPSTGTCSCSGSAYGSECNLFKCPRNCSNNGACSITSGICSCTPPYQGRSCNRQDCPYGNCGGVEGGFCNRSRGLCACRSDRSGGACSVTNYCAGETVEVNWWTSFDKKGWSFCPVGSFITALYRSNSICTGINCLEMVRCEKPCENKSQVPVGRCYAEDWWKSFDTEGWSKCANNYFLRGLFRNSCQSLYCIEEALCCSLAQATWVSCSKTNWYMSFDDKGWSAAAEGLFITGFYRSHCHDLKCLESASQCSFRREMWNSAL